MVIAFPADVLGRLHRIDEAEGIPVLEIVHQAVAVWSQLDADGRRILGVAAMQLVVDGIHNGGAR